jgi:hypothetical protein
MERKRRQRAKTGRAPVVTGLQPIERLTSWEIALVRDRIEAIVLGSGGAASIVECVPDVR